MSGWWSGYVLGLAMGDSYSSEPSSSHKLENEYKCPKCGGTKIRTTIQIDSGHIGHPDPNSIWECENPECGYKTLGYEFLQVNQNNAVDDFEEAEPETAAKEKIHNEQSESNADNAENALWYLLCAVLVLIFMFCFVCVMLY